MTFAGKAQLERMLQAEIAKLEAALAAIQTVKVITPCAGCLNFDSSSGFCTVFNDTVPKEFQLQGCDSFEDEIPF